MVEDSSDLRLDALVGKNKLSAISRAGSAKVLAKILGLFWILDGILQMQPQMFTQTFVSSVLQPVTTNQPHFLASWIYLAIGLFSYNTFLANLGAILVQLLIGAILIAFPPTKLICKVGLAVSIVWGVVVWVLVEGLGGLLTGSATFYTGAPGSIVLYIVPAILLLFPKYLSTSNLGKAAGSAFMLGGLLQLQPTFWTSDGITSMFSMATSDSISFISQPANFLSNILSSSPIFGNAIITASLFGLGALLFIKTNRLVVSTAMTCLLFIWWMGQDFGGVLTFYNGTSTDPNTAPVIVGCLLIPMLIGYKRKVAQATMLQPHSQPIFLERPEPSTREWSKEAIPIPTTHPLAATPEIIAASLENLNHPKIEDSDLINS